MLRGKCNRTSVIILPKMQNWNLIRTSEKLKDIWQNDWPILFHQTSVSRRAKKCVIWDSLCWHHGDNWWDLNKVCRLVHSILMLMLSWFWSLKCGDERGHPCLGRIYLEGIKERHYVSTRKKTGWKYLEKYRASMVNINSYGIWVKDIQALFVLFLQLWNHVKISCLNSHQWRARKV